VLFKLNLNLYKVKKIIEKNTSPKKNGVKTSKLNLLLSQFLDLVILYYLDNGF
jgi:hypothetical protein